jgi:hypothetical protein
VHPPMLVSPNSISETFRVASSGHAKEGATRRNMRRADHDIDRFHSLQKLIHPKLCC